MRGLKSTVDDTSKCNCGGHIVLNTGTLKWNEATGFCNLWESINGEGSWESNPWVWVVEFRRLDI